MKIGILTLLLLCVQAKATAQSINRVLKLSNGSELRGELLPATDGKIHFRMRDGSVWVYTPEEVDTIMPWKNGQLFGRYYSRVTIGALAGEEAAFSFQYANGFVANKHLHAGVALGTERLDWNRFFSLALEGQYFLFKRNNSPYALLQAGTLMPFSRNGSNKPGYFVAGSLGMQHFFSNRVGITTSLGYRFAYLSFSSQWWDDFMTIRQLHYVEWRFGLVFR